MKAILILLLLISFNSFGAIKYVATTGNDTTGNGSFSTPYRSIDKAWDNISAGDTIYIRGGLYAPDINTQDIRDKTATAARPTRIMAYNNESVIITYAGKESESEIRGLRIQGIKYLYIYKIRITQLPQTSAGAVNYGFWLWNCENVTFDQCVADHIGGMGFVVYSYSPGLTKNIYHINCDSYAQMDPLSTGDPYGGSNAFGATGTTTALYTDSLYYIGCRGWMISDDIWDFIYMDGHVFIDNCWAFLAGFDEDMNFLEGTNGIGFKMGSNQGAEPDTYKHVITRCLAFDNAQTGFDQNMTATNYAPSTWYNNTAFRNGKGALAGVGNGFYFGNSSLNVKNIAMNNVSVSNSNWQVIYGSNVIQSNNSWNGDVTASTADFISIDTTGVTGARQADGSLPNLQFLRLKSDSDLVDAGTYVGLTHSGAALIWGRMNIHHRPIG